MVKRKCLYCGFVSNAIALTDNYVCPLCGKEKPLGRQLKLGDEKNVKT